VLGYPFVVVGEPPETSLGEPFSRPNKTEEELVAQERNLIANLLASYTPPTKRWNRHRQMSDIGKFADHYSSQIGKSPFASAKSAR
jgi:hypothetical protein